MALSKEKKDALFQYYLSKGFDHTVDEMVTELGITHKTFFNRYGSKDESVMVARKYWHSTVSERFMSKVVFCNHSVEELMFFVLEMQYMRQIETVYFEYEYQRHSYITDETPMMDMLRSILQKGVRHYQFDGTLDVEAYAKFFIQSMLDYFPVAENKVLALYYMLSPLLNERGWELLDEMDLMGFII